MFSKVLSFYKVSKPSNSNIDKTKIDSKYKKLRWSVFLSATIGYSLFYVLRLSFNVVKKPIVDAGIFNESELGIIGSALFFTYAIGKLTNGFLADRSNIKRFMSTGLFLSAVTNLILGFNSAFIVFAVLWGMNGWFQSMGAAPSVVSLSRWFSNSERGTYYGIWSSSHSIGKAITFIGTAFIVSVFGWQWGFYGASIAGLIGSVLVFKFLYDTPESEGLPSIAEYKNDYSGTISEKKSVSTLQFEVLKNPYIWILALSSATMYISRYALEGWGMFFLEAEKGYSTLEAGSIVSISSITGIIGTVSCGYISDKYFKGSRNVPALLFGLLNVISISLFLFYPNGDVWVDTLSMALFGLAIGVLITFLGGLMAIDIASKKASGAALGLVGIASYIGAGIQEVVSGYLIETNKVMLNGTEVYDFAYVKIFWLGAAVLSVLLALFVWNAKESD